MILSAYLNGTAVTQIPTWPGLAVTFAPGPDPTVSIPVDLRVGPDGTVTVPVNIDDPHPEGSTGLTQALIALTYDPTVFDVSAADILCKLPMPPAPPRARLGLTPRPASSISTSVAGCPMARLPTT